MNTIISKLYIMIEQLSVTINMNAYVREHLQLNEWYVCIRMPHIMTMMHCVDSERDE